MTVLNIVVVFAVLTTAYLLPVSGEVTGHCKSHHNIHDEWDSWWSAVRLVRNTWALQDSEMFADFYASDGVMVSKTLGMAEGRDEIQQAYANLFETQKILNMKTVLVGITKDSAIAFTQNTYLDENEVVVDNSTELEIFTRNKDNEWQIQETYEFQTNLVPFPKLKHIA